MFSKLTSRQMIISLLSGCLLLTGCDQFLRGRSKEQEKEARVVQISTDQVKCLENTAKNLQKFLGDEGGSEPLDYTISCVQNSLKTFARLTRGKQPGGYLASEVQYFFNTFLLKENQVSDDFLKEIMKVKVVAVGGSPDFVTNLELEQFGQFLGNLKTQLQPLQGKMRIALFHGNEVGKVSDDQVHEVHENVAALGQYILKNTKLTSSRYQWTDFISFLEELHTFIGDSRELSELFKWVPLAESVKLLFLGDNAKLVSDSDWQGATTWAVDAYETALKFFYEIKDNPFETPQQWNTLLAWVDQGIHAIESSPAMRDRKILEASALDRLTDEIYKLNLFQTVLSPDMIKSTYRNALVHFIEVPSGRGSALMVQGLTEAHLRILKQEYNVWKLSQRFLVDTYLANPNEQLNNLQWYFDRYDIQKILLDATPLEREELEKSWADFRTLLNNYPTITYDQKMKVRVAHHAEVQPFSFVGANYMNGMRSFARMVMRGYGDRQARFAWDSKITRGRLVNLEEDFRDFGRAIGLLDPRENNAALRTFDQGNFFTFHGNGDELLTATETFEVFNLMLSGARTQLNEVYADLKIRGCLISEKDIFGKPFVKERCYYDLMHEKADVYMDNLPGMAVFLKGLNDQQWATVYNGLLSLSLSKEHRTGYLESSEIRSMNTVYHFLETLMVVYDTDANQTLSEAEVLKALPRFGPFIQSMIAKKPSWVDRNVGPYFLEDILLYLAYEGKEPTAMDLMGFKTRRAMGNLGEVSRTNLVKLVSCLNTILNDQGVDATR